MRRSAFIDLVGIGDTRLDVLRRRRQLPFAGAAEVARGWQDYSLQDAFLLRLQMDLMDGGGIGPSDAMSILRVPPHLHTAADEPEDAWIGEISKPDLSSGIFYGTAAQLADRLSRPPVASRVILANASRAARAILARAADLGLEG